jgi:hypothetical protein
MRLASNVSKKIITQFQQSIFQRWATLFGSWVTLLTNLLCVGQNKYNKYNKDYLNILLIENRLLRLIYLKEAF